MPQLLILENDNTYEIILDLKFNEKTYGYLMNINNFLDVLIVELKENEVLLVKDKNVLKELLQRFNQMFRIMED